MSEAFCEKHMSGEDRAERAQDPLYNPCHATNLERWMDFGLWKYMTRMVVVRIPFVEY